MGLPAGWDLFCDNVRLAITLTGIVSGAAAQKRSQELLVEVAHKAHSFPAHLSGRQKQHVLSCGERIMHRESAHILLTAPNETSLLLRCLRPGRSGEELHPADEWRDRAKRGTPEKACRSIRR